MGKLHIIWDLDGTLINSEEEVLETLIKSVREAGLSENEQKAPFRVGPTIDKILDVAFGEDRINIEKKKKNVDAIAYSERKEQVKARVNMDAFSYQRGACGIDGAEVLQQIRSNLKEEWMTRDEIESLMACSLRSSNSRSRLLSKYCL